MQPSDITRGATEVLAEQGHRQERAVDEIYVRMPKPDEAHRLDLGPGTPVACHVSPVLSAVRGPRGSGQLQAGSLPTERSLDSAAYWRLPAPVVPRALIDYRLLAASKLTAGAGPRGERRQGDLCRGGMG